MRNLDQPKLHRSETVAFHHSAVEKVIRLMRKDPGAALDWKALSEVACISRHHFLRVFEEQTGLSPHRFLIYLRMEMAKNLLIDTSLPVNDIGMKVGYSSSATFVRTFKGLVGVAPGHFRLQSRQMNGAKVEELLTMNSNQPEPSGMAHPVRLELKFPETFVGNIIVWHYSPAERCWMPIGGALVPGTNSIQLVRPMPSAKGYLYAMGFPAQTNVKQYFLPRQDSPWGVSQVASAPAANTSSEAAISLTLQFPSIFQPPILVSLPFLLARAENGNVFCRPLEDMANPYPGGFMAYKNCC